ncbi:uncharacterized protein N7483_000813 [Penicillium malachiteum]|uniref:uncharacterized protein n=1 Tax=Penicillium malachiteum TaxID=1324776 RepID=UPI0025485016|nr:uncharacterized protein N7483_000813 [Penicillium malachiteum]KAJ5735688.1 hypothetical protein N7483_000813 [Penicillium malachiteum]
MDPFRLRGSSREIASITSTPTTQLYRLHLLSSEPASLRRTPSQSIIQRRRLLNGHNLKTTGLGTYSYF